MIILTKIMPGKIFSSVQCICKVALLLMIKERKTKLSGLNILKREDDWKVDLIIDW